MVTSVAMPTMTTGAGIPSPQNQINSLPYMIPKGGTPTPPLDGSLVYTKADGLGQPKTITPLSANAGNPNTPVPGANSTNSTPMPNMADVQKQMASNSAAYNATTDPATRQALHDQNMQIGTGIGGTYDANSGKWSFPNTPTPMNPSAVPSLREFGYMSTPNTPTPGMTSGGASTTTQPPAQSGAQQSTNQYTQLTPAQLQQEVQSRIDQLRQGVQQGVTSYDTARKNAYDYANQMTNDNRVLAAGMFHEQNDPFAGSTNYKEAETLRSNNMQDAAAAATYQADVAANDQKLADFNASAPEQAQTMYDQLAGAERAYGQTQDQNNFNNGIAQAGLTGQYQGAPTLQAQGQNFQQGIAQAGLTGQYNGAPTLQAQGQKFDQGIAQAGVTGVYNPSGQSADQIQAQMDKNSKAYATATPAQQQDLHNQNLALAALLGKTYDAATGTYSGGTGQIGTPTLQAQGQQFQEGATAAGLTGKYNGLDTLQAAQQKFQNGATLAGLTGQYNGTPTLQAQGQTFNQNMQTKQFDQTAKDDTFNQNLQTKQFNNTVTQQQIQNGQWSKTFDNQMKQWAAQNKLDWSKFNQDTKIALAQLAVSQQQAAASALSASNSANYQAKSLADSEANTNFDQQLKIMQATGVAPGTPATPGTPAVPATQGTPATPWKPGSPVPGEPWASWTPGTPATSAKPGTPGTPAIPGTPASGGIPGIEPGTPYAGSSVQQTHTNESKWSTQFDALPAGQQVGAVESNKAEIIKELGSPAYNSMHAQYVAQSAKDSTNNLSNAITQLQDPNITRAQALQYAQKIQSHMGSADYKRLNSWIGTNKH